jgi:hypothetical protein
MNVPIELGYNGDYPGVAFIRINGRSSTPKEESALCSIFEANGIKQLFDKMGAVRTQCGQEHARFYGSLTVIADLTETPAPERIQPTIQDVVPAHYAKGVTPWELERHMESSGSAFVDSRRTDAIEYCFRMKYDLLSDLKKARHCIEAAISHLEEHNPVSMPKNTILD